MSFKAHFSRFLTSAPERLHVAAHSHHPWPDVTLAAQQQAWLDAAALQDGKWEHVFGHVLPEAQAHIARVLNLPDPSTIAVAPSTHELVRRLLSCLPVPARILSTDAEFHSFTRQVRRMEEAGVAVVERVPAEPYDTFADRFAAAAARGGHDLVFFSQVHFDSGYVLRDVQAAVAAVPSEETFVAIDGYHGFVALPTDLGQVAGRAFYVAGGYKYAMAGEGACFLHCPPGYGARPLDTGWYAGFGSLSGPQDGPVAYPADGRRFLGATFDPSGLYRFNAVQRWLGALGLTVKGIHEHVASLQRRFLDGLDALGLPGLGTGSLLPPLGTTERGHFLTFHLSDADGVFRRIQASGVVLDVRADRLRIGFGIYHDPGDIDELCARIARALGD